MVSICDARRTSRTLRDTVQKECNAPLLGSKAVFFGADVRLPGTAEPFDGRWQMADGVAACRCSSPHGNTRIMDAGFVSSKSTPSITP